MKYYSDSELLLFLTDIESDLCERKQSWTGDVPDKSRQAICAFSNDFPHHHKPGVLFIGLNDDGTPSGLAITDSLLKTLADIKTDGNILPLPSMIVQKRRLNGGDVAVVMVQPSDSPPVRYKGRIWVRTGSRRGIATLQDERILNEKRRFGDAPYENHIVSNASLNDLNRLIFEQLYLPAAFSADVIQGDERTYEQKLSACGMVNNGEEALPTVFGILAIGKNPRNLVPSAYIQFLRIDGYDYSDPIIDEEVIEGDLSKLLIRVDDKMKAHNRVKVDFTSSATEKRVYQYPLSALQQIVRNAVMHRTYENTHAPVRMYWFNDRIEVISAGGPFGAVTEENFGHPGLADYRNPRLADGMKVFGFVQRFGVGIQSARKALNENGNPPLELLPEPTAVRTVIRATFSVVQDAPEKEEKDFSGQNSDLINDLLNKYADLLKAIINNPADDYQALAEGSGVSEATIKRQIQKLKKAGILKRSGSKKAGHWIILTDRKHSNE